MIRRDIYYKIGVWGSRFMSIKGSHFILQICANGRTIRYHNATPLISMLPEQDPEYLDLFLRYELLLDTPT